MASPKPPDVVTTHTSKLSEMRRREQPANIPGFHGQNIVTSKNRWPPNLLYLDHLEQDACKRPCCWWWWWWWCCCCCRCWCWSCRCCRCWCCFRVFPHSTVAGRRPFLLSYIRCTWTHLECYANWWPDVSSTCTHLDATQLMWGGWVFVFGWGGVGWVGMLTFVALAHILNATQHDVSSTCTHLECYATWCFLPLAHISMLRNWCGGVGCLTNDLLKHQAFLD